MSTIETFLLAMLLILSVPYLIWRLGNTDYYAPLVVVQILTGIVLGPGLLGAAFPEYYQLVFNTEVTNILSGIGSWAVMVFVWLAGLELDLQEAWQHRRESSITAGLAFSVPLVAGSIAAALMLWHSNEWMGSAAQDWQFIVGIGMACSVTALPILVLLMEKLSILRTPLGQRVLRYASLDDLVVWGVLAMILMDWHRLGRQATFIVIFIAATIIARRAFPRMPERDRWYAGLIWLSACGLFADWAGLHYMVGAFLSGAVLDHRWFKQESMDQLRHFLLLVLMPVFFLNTGLRTYWNMDGATVLIAAVLLLIACVGGKLWGVQLAGKILRWPEQDAKIIGWLLQTKALIMIIFANILLDRDIISHSSFTALLLMAIASTMLTIPMVAPRLRKDI